MTEPLQRVGAIGSPYSRKMRAVLRYRRIPFHWVGHGSSAHQKLPPPPLPLMPVLHFPTATGTEATSDSTFQIRRLETDFKGRRVIPSDPVVAFFDFLIEDYADEWVTKMMFHYRWAVPGNAANAKRASPTEGSRPATAVGWTMCWRGRAARCSSADDAPLPR